MLLRLFKGSSPGVILLIGLISAAAWISAFIHPSAFSSNQFESGSMPLYRLLSLAAGRNILTGTAISLAIAAVMAFLVVHFNTASFFINERTYLPGLLYILTGCLFPEYQAVNPVFPASLFLFIAFMRIMDAYRKPGLANNFFDAGILISVGSLFYSSLIWFGLLIIIGIVIIRTVSFSEIAISFLGLLTPYLILFGIYYALGKDLGTLMSLIGASLFQKSAGYYYPRLTIVAVIFVAILIIVSVTHLFIHYNTKKIKSRQTFSLLIWLFLITVAVYLFMPPVSAEIIWIVAIPVSYFLTHYFLFTKKKLIPEILFSVLLILITIVQIRYLR